LKFFIERPIFASTIALMIVLAGTVCMLVLPISQYPPLVPPAVQVSTQYIGASSEVVADTVTTPLEEQLNGAANMIYMTSNSTNNGDAIITMTFEVGFDQDIGQVEALTRSNEAISELPSEVQQIGLTVQKFSSNLLLGVNLVSPNGTYDGRFLQNYGDIHIADVLARIPGVALVNNFGLNKYAMRIWLDPAKLTNLGLTANDVVDAIQEQNQQVAAGKIGQAPGSKEQPFVYQLNTLGRLSEVEQFADIIVRAEPGGAIVRLSDIGRVEFGAEEYDWNTQLNGRPTAILVISQLANANGLKIKKAVVEAMERLERNFPEDMKWTIVYDTTVFIKESIREVVITLLEAVALVFVVVFVFLQNWRSTLIPCIAVPVSLIGTFIFMALFGFSINLLSLLGLVLAVALVVDDAIVVVENVNRKLEEGATDLKKATEAALAEVRSPIIATTLVMMAVFVPMAFIPGMTGQLYNQFALTIAISVGISAMNSLSLSPALCGVLLRPQSGRKNVLFRGFNRGFAWLSSAYAGSVEVLSKAWVLVLLVFFGLCAACYFVFTETPQGFIPEEDQGYLLAIVELPEAAAIERTEAVVTKVGELARKVPGVKATVEVSGYNLIDSVKQTNVGIAFVVLDPFPERTTPDTQLDGIVANLRRSFAAIPEARVLVANAPPIPGLGATGGFTFEVEDLDAQGVKALTAATLHFIDAVRKRPEVTGVYTTFSPSVPQYFLDIDRLKAKSSGVSVTDIFNALQINLGSLYVNEFNKYGKVYRVYLQAEKDARMEVRDIGRLRVRNAIGEMISLDNFVKVKPFTGAYNIPHYNTYGSIAVNGAPAPGFSSGQAVAAMEDTANSVLPKGFSYEWTGITYQQLLAGNLAPLIFALSLVFVFLVLAAQYESWVMPFMILMTIPFGLLGAVGGLLLRHLDLNVYGQIGLVMLIGLVAKNSILIVEFATDLRRQGKSILEAAKTAAEMRLRPILMTALAFIVGLFPLVVASGAGASARKSLGTAVVSGLALATILIIMVPLFYYMLESLRERRPKAKPQGPEETPRQAEGEP